MPQRSNSARFLWGDRNPIFAGLAWNNSGIAPHADTVRGTYTVPTGKKAQVHGCAVYMEIQSVAAPAAARFANIQVAVGGTGMVLALVSRNADQNVVGQAAGSMLGVSYSLQAGNILTLHTADASTGGTLVYNESAFITEYDA